MPFLILPPNRPLVRRTFVPYVFNRSEIRSLIRATKQNDNTRSKIDHYVVRALVIFLYATGAGVGEALNLACSDIDLSARLIRMRARFTSRNRTIPMGRDVHEVISKYLAWRMGRGYKCQHLFVNKHDECIFGRTMSNQFGRVCRIAGVSRHDGSGALPRLIDLRYSFAVHRITSWIKNEANLNRMLPAMAAYMGQVGLGATERYVSMTPERYRKELRLLSPARRAYRWKNDKALMDFLAKL